MHISAMSSRPENRFLDRKLIMDKDIGESQLDCRN